MHRLTSVTTARSCSRLPTRPRTTSRRYRPEWGLYLTHSTPGDHTLVRPPGHWLRPHLSRPLGTTSVPWDKAVGSNLATVSDERRWGQVPIFEEQLDMVWYKVPTSELPHHGFTPGMDPEVAKPAPLVAATTSTAALSPARRLAETALPRGRTSAVPAWSRWFRTARAPFLFAWGRALRHPRTGMTRRL